MIWHRRTSEMRPLEPFKIVAPPTRNAVEQLLTLQDAVTQVEGLIHSVNIILLKLRALLFAVVPQVHFSVLGTVTFVLLWNQEIGFRDLNVEGSGNLCEELFQCSSRALCPHSTEYSVFFKRNMYESL